MIWHSEVVTVLGQPDNVTISLIGFYDTTGVKSSIVELILQISSDDGVDKDISVYTHNPTMMRREEPSPEDVSQRYQAKVNKIKHTLASSDYASLFKK